MKSRLWLILGAGLICAGCADPGYTTPSASTTGATGNSSAPGGPPGGGAKGGALATPAAGTGRPQPAEPPKPVPITDGVATLTPENTKIEFIGTHAKPKSPDPRTGGFEKFTGEAKVDIASGELTAVVVDIDTTSIWTQFPPLTTHLNSPDFFETREHPTAKFESTSISGGEGDNRTMTGNLTLLGNTEEISFPIESEITSDGLIIKASFEIDRTKFGMDKLQEGVEPIVKLNVSIGEKTAPLPAGGGFGGGGGPGGPGGPGGGRGGAGANFDPVAFFKSSDADGDGKLAGGEIPDRMKENLDEIDTDKDGAVSQDEFQERMRQFRAKGKGGFGGPGGGRPGGPAPGGPGGAGPSGPGSGGPPATDAGEAGKNSDAKDAKQPDETGAKSTEG